MIVQCFLAAVCAPLPVCLGQQLEAHWELDEGVGTVAGDATGGGQDGTLVGPTWVSDTPDGSAFALNFDGNDDRVDVGNIDLGGGALTLALWFKADDFGTRDARLISKATGVQAQQHYWMLSTIFNGGQFKLRFRLKTAGNTSTLIASTGALTPGVWNHAAAVYDGGAMRLYLNGIEVGSLAKTGSVDVNAAVAAAIGHQPPGAGQQAFDGSIDDVRLYRAALSALEIQALISGGNQVPVALDDGYSVDQHAILVVDANLGVLANDTDLDLDMLTAQLATDVTHGSLSLATDGSFTYTPDMGHSGSDFFTYRASDGAALSNLATVSLSVVPPAGADVVAHYRFDQGAGSTASDSAGGNDGALIGPAWTSDTGDGSPFSLDFDGVDDLVDLGTLDIDGAGLTLACWLRPDAFAIRDARLISKATGTQAQAHYWMLSTIFNGSTPTLRFRLKTNGTTSTLVGTGGALSPGVWTHAAAVYDGATMRLYQDGVEVGSLSKSGAIDQNPGVMVAIGRQPIGAGQQHFDGAIDDVRLYRRALSAAEIGALLGGNQSPVAVDDGYGVDADAMLTVDAANGVLDNDSDGEMDPLDALLLDDVSSGTLALALDGSFVYTPMPGFAGIDSFDYRASDGNSFSNPATVTITVNSPSGGPPVAVDDGYGIEAGGSLVVTAQAGVLSNDDDPDMDLLTAALSSDVSNGSLVLASDGSFTYSPDGGFAGIDTFVYRAHDGFSFSNEATVAISVTAPPGDELEAHWRLDDGSGSVAADSSGLGHVGALVGPAWSPETADGSAFSLSFDGVDDRVDIGSFDLPGEALTIACWLRPDAFGIRDARLVSKATGVQENDHYWMLSTIFRGATPTLRFRLKTDGATTTLIASTGALPVGSWSHAAAVYDGSFMRLYLDGVEVGATAKTGSISANPGVMAAVGRQPLGAGDQAFDGLIDDVRIYRRALGAAEIGSLFSGKGALPTANFQVAGQSIAEDSGGTGVVVTLSQIAAADVSVPFTLSGTADGSDYTITSSPLVIPAGQLSGSIVVTVQGDSVTEPDETVVLTMGTPTGAQAGNSTVHTLVLLNDDVPASAFASEDFNQCGLPGSWTFVDPQGDAVLEIRGVGSQDAQLVMSVPAGVHEAFDSLTVPYIRQAAADGDFELEVKFDSAVSGSVQDQGVLILEDGANWLRFDVYSTGATVNAFAASTVGGVSTLRVNGPIAASTAPLWIRVTRVADQWALLWSFDGSSFTQAGTFSHALSVQDVGLYAGNNGPAHTSVVDYFFETSSPVAPEDGPPLAGVGRALGVIVDGGGSVVRDPDLALYYCSESVSVAPVADAGWTFDHWEGDLSGSADPETLTMSQARNIRAVFLPEVLLPVVDFATASQNVAEDGPPVGITVNLSASSAQAVSVPFGVTGSASNPGDYTIDASPLVIPAGATSGVILLTPVNDTDVDPSETVSLTLGVPTGATLGSNLVHTATLVDDEGVQLVSDDFNQCALANIWTFTDPVGDATFLTRGPGTDDAQLLLSIPSGVHDAYDVIGTPRLTQPVPDTDFEIEVKFDSVVTGSTQDQGVLILQDEQNWLRFDFYSIGSTLNLFAASTLAGSSSTEFNGSLGSTGSPTWMRIARVGDQWSLSWSSDGSTFLPAISFNHVLVAQEAGVYVGNSGPAHTAVVDYFFETSSPISPEDGAVSGATPRTLTLSTNGSGSLAQTPTQPVFYCDEVVTLTASPANGWQFDHWEGDASGTSNPLMVAMTAPRAVTAVFLPDNNLPSVGFVSAAQDLPEGAGSTGVTVSLSQVSAMDVTVPYTLGGTATNTQDYTIASSPLVISAGQLSADIVITPIDDGTDEPDETLIVTLGSPTNANLLGIVQHTATLLDDDLPSVEFAFSAQNVGEAAAPASIQVDLSSMSAVEVTVPFSLGGTASTPADYTIGASPFVIPAGQTSATVLLTPVNDGLTEADETVTLTLGAPTGALLGASTLHTATLVDDDGVPTVEFASAGQNVGEGAGSTMVLVQLSSVANVAVTIPYTVGGSATLVDDYTHTPSPAVISAGMLSTNVTLTLVDDGLVESGETVVLTIGTPVNAGLGSNLVHTATILDNDSSAPVSDDFNAPNLRQDLWTFVDPLGDGSLQIVGAGTSDAQLILSVPADVPHEAWTPLNVPRVMQSVPDADLDVIAKFESQLTTAYQNDGLIFDQEDGANWVRFDFRYTGSHLQAYASRTVNNNPATVLAVDISPGPWTNTSPLFMRVTRVGDDWTYRYSFDGTNWTTVGTFTRSLQLSAMGPFCGNAGSRPAHSTVVDYVFNNLAPIAMEDFGSPSDTTEPFIYRVDGRALNDTAVEVSWETDEAALGTLEYGTTTYYELGFWGATQPAAHDHTFLVTGLDPDTDYHFRVLSEDPVMNLALSSDVPVTTFPEGFTEGPTIRFFYGQEVGSENRQRFGHLGRPQTWVNVLGNVIDFNGTVQSLTYRINAGGSPRILSMGADLLWDGPYRLELPGDFNADIDPADLLSGFNDIIFTAVDDEANETIEICRLDYTPGVVWPQTYSIDWNTVTDIQDVAQVVDGEWVIEDDPFHPGQKVLRNPVPGYDRLVAIGDLTWDNYEVIVPVVANQFNAAGFHPISNSFATGFILRWPGHSGPETQQPRPGFFPFGGLFAYRWYPMSEEWNHYGTNFGPNITTTQNPIVLGVQYILKARVQTLGDGSRLYQLRAWEEGQAEPGTWFFQATHAPGTGTDGGSLLLLSNYVDVSFGNITITALP